MSASSRFAASLGAALLFVTSLSQAVEPIPVTQKAYGTTYPKLATRWLEWVYSIPAATNPIADVDGSFGATGQSGKVWLLAGNFGGTTTRSLTVPSGTALFFPIVNYFWLNTPELGDQPWSPAWEAAVRQQLADVVDTAHGITLEVDGVPSVTVDNLRVRSNVGTCVISAGSLGGPSTLPGPHECVADGYWALLDPLSVGNHTIRFTGGTSGFSLDVTYNITVKPRKKL